MQYILQTIYILHSSGISEDFGESSNAVYRHSTGISEGSGEVIQCSLYYKQSIGIRESLGDVIQCSIYYRHNTGDSIGRSSNAVYITVQETV